MLGKKFDKTKIKLELNILMLFYFDAWYFLGEIIYNIIIKDIYFDNLTLNCEKK